MRVAMGCTVLEQGLSAGEVDGIGHYSQELINHLKDIDDIDLRLFSWSSTAPSDFERPVARVGNFGVQATYSLVTGRPFPGKLSKPPDDWDLIHSPDHLVPCVRKVPVVATLMDAIPLSHPEWVSYPLKKLKNSLWRRSTHWAHHVETISEHSKQELVEWFRIPEHRISITPLGVNRRWFSKPSPDELQSASKKYGLPEQYLLFVGTLQPRKNVGRLITAHRMLSESMRRDFPLVVVGRAGWGCEEVVKMLIEGDRNRILWLNYLPGEDLLPLVQLATALVFPSLHEGFGLPVLEAFAAGVPVITSNTTALPEVAGQAALLVDPESTSDIADAMRMLVTDDALSRKLRSLGRERAKWFSWERTVKKTVAVYQKARSAF